MAFGHQVLRKTASRLVPNYQHETPFKISSTRVKTAQRYISYFETLDTEILESVLADDFVAVYAPSSVSPPPKPPGLSDKQWAIGFVHALKGVMASFPMTAKEYIDAGDRVVAWTTSEAHFRDDVKGEDSVPEEWEYKGEYVIMFTFDESGEKITKMVEFIDSKSVSEKLQPAVTKAMANASKRDAH